MKIVLCGASQSVACGVRDHTEMLAQQFRANEDVHVQWACTTDGRPGLHRWARRVRLASLDAGLVILAYSAFSHSIRGVPTAIRELRRSLDRTNAVRIGILHEMAFPWRPSVRAAVWAPTQRAALRHLVGGLDHLVVTNPDYADWLNTRHWLPRQEVHVIPAFSTIPTCGESEVAPVAWRCAVLGWGAPSSQPELVADGLAALRSQVEVLLIGAPGPSDPAFFRWARVLRERAPLACVRAPGILPPEDLARELASCAAAVFSDHHGPSGRRTFIAAALANGVPVVAAPGPGTWRPMVESGAVIESPADGAAWARALRPLLELAPERSFASRAGRRFAKDELSAEGAAARLRALSRTDLKGPSAEFTRPRIAVVTHDADDGRGGMERAVNETLSRIAAGFEVTLISRSCSPALALHVRHINIRLPPFPVSFVLPIFAIVAASHLRRLNPDVLITVGAIVPTIADVAWVHLSHAGLLARTGHLAPRDAPIVRRLNTAVVRLISLGAERWTYRRAGCVVAVSAALRRELTPLVPESRLAVVPNGVDTTYFQPDPLARAASRAQLGVDDNAFVILFVGGDWDHKGLAITIEAIALGEQGELWVIGRGDEPRFRAIARKLGVAHRIRFLGSQTDMSYWLNAGDVLVLPSAYETFGLVGFEAAACGLPLISTAVGELPNLVGDGIAGRLVTPQPRAIAQAIAELAAPTLDLSSLGAAARQRASTYTWAQTANALLHAANIQQLPELTDAPFTISDPVDTTPLHLGSSAHLEAARRRSTEFAATTTPGSGAWPINPADLTRTKTKQGVSNRMADLEYTGERMHLTAPPRTHDELAHLMRYRWAAQRVKGRTLDIATGTGYGATQLVAASTTVVAADIELRALAGLGAPQLFPMAAALPDLPFSSSSFDTIVSFETIEHVRDDQAALAEFRRLVRADGHLLLSTPNKAVTSPDGPPSNPFHIREYFLDELLELVASGGFDVQLLCQLAPRSGLAAGQMRRLVARFPMLCRPGHWWDTVAHGNSWVTDRNDADGEPVIWVLDCIPTS